MITNTSIGTDTKIEKRENLVRYYKYDLGFLRSFIYLIIMTSIYFIYLAGAAILFPERIYFSSVLTVFCVAAAIVIVYRAIAMFSVITVIFSEEGSFAELFGSFVYIFLVFVLPVVIAISNTFDCVQVDFIGIMSLWGLRCLYCLISNMIGKLRNKIKAVSATV